MNTSLSAIMLVSAAAGFAVCAGGLAPRGRRRHVRIADTSAAGRASGVDGGFLGEETPDAGRTPGSAVVGMAVMLAAMADMASDAVHLLPGVVWGMLMLLTGPVMLVGVHRASGSMHCGFSMHRSLSMIAMAALVIVGGHGYDAGPNAPADTGHDHGGPSLLPVVLATGVAALLAYTVVLVVAHHRGNRGGGPGGTRSLSRAGVESCLAAVSVAAMAASMFA